jgi:flagellar biosynthetic protein FlhB
MAEDADRSEQATEHKLTEARKKGSVARSADLMATAMLAGLVAAIYASSWDSLRLTVRLNAAMLSRAGRADWGIDGVAQWLGQLLIGLLTIVGPLFLILAVVAIVANVAQTGPIFTLQPLAPDLERINPASGFKRLFSMRTVFEAGKSLIKLAILGSVVYAMIHDAVPGLVALETMPAKGYARLLIGLCAALLVKLVLTLLLIALVDVIFVRWEYAKRMRMSKRDVKDESKNREGDPRIRSRIRELRKEMLKRSKSMARVPSADVLITNPTHLAVALCYDHGSSGAPQVVAKGAGEVARKMRELASRHQIPVVQNRMLARALFREVDYEGYVPEKLYPQVAKIMVWVYAMRESRRNSGRAV